MNNRDLHRRNVPPLPAHQTKWFLMHPEEFDITRLEANEMQQGTGSNVIAKIPQTMKDRIRFKLNETGTERKIELVISQDTDPETGEIREETITVGEGIGSMLLGMMITTDVYHDYFDVYGNLINDPMKPKEAKAAPSAVWKASPDSPEGKLCKRIAEELQKKNMVRLGDKVLVRIPKEKTRLLPPNKHGTIYVEYTYMQWYDPTEKQSRNRKTTIGQVADECPEAMIPNDRYRRFFDMDTGLPIGEDEKGKLAEIEEYTEEKANAGETEEEIAKAENEKNFQRSLDDICFLEQMQLCLMSEALLVQRT